MSARRSPWRTSFAYRAYIAGLFWSAGFVTSLLTDTPDQPGCFTSDWTRLVFYMQLRRSLAGSISLPLEHGEPFEAATIAFLFSGAELLERFAVDRSRRAITRLLELAPEYADRLLPNGTTERVQASALARGDKVLVRPGDRLPADGVVVTGVSSVNAATITGESLPVAKRAGDRGFAGTLNTDGALDIEVEADAAHSTLARIVQLVRQAEGRRAPVEEFVQRFARFYTPAVTLLAFLVMVIPPMFAQTSALDWFLRGITLLVIACPCALVIATPVTVVSALTSAARHGVLIKGGVYLEALGRTRVLAVDKTGTLTTGSLAVTDFQSRGAVEPNENLRRIATLEARSEHPIGEAIVRFAEQKSVDGEGPADAFTAVPGYGIRGRINGVDLVVGTEELVGAAVAAQWNPARPGTMQVYATSSDDTQGLGGAA